MKYKMSMDGTGGVGVRVGSNSFCRPQILLGKGNGMLQQFNRPNSLPLPATPVPFTCLVFQDGELERLDEGGSVGVGDGCELSVC